MQHHVITLSCGKVLKSTVHLITSMQHCGAIAIASCCWWKQFHVFLQSRASPFRLKSFERVQVLSWCSDSVFYLFIFHTASSRCFHLVLLSDKHDVTYTEKEYPVPKAALCPYLFIILLIVSSNFLSWYGMI